MADINGSNSSDHMTSRLFAYGSLAEGMVHYQKIQEFIRSTQGGAIVGSVYRSQVGFPVLVRKGEDLVSGQILEIQSSPFLWELLDRFHGVHPQDPSKSLFEREMIGVSTPAGLVDAYAYFLNPERLTSRMAKIEGGDWRDSLARRPPLTDQLTERQKQYVLRLGATKGREIIPIDLPLYRELVNLEIIVDKGRRLALTKLGHELFQYLV